MPGDDLLFQRMSVSTIGAVRFHGRVRDGIGWVTDAMVTKQWSQRAAGFNRDRVNLRLCVGSGWYRPNNKSAELTLMAGFYKREQSY